MNLFNLTAVAAITLYTQAQAADTVHYPPQPAAQDSRYATRPAHYSGVDDCELLRID
ncbi:hypothetical protein NCHU2750_11570 [Neorhizobium sp. NCHU2750]|nr:hypothetical protein NCHU2750_11570 [Neorhizobium sp. NCHU2750]